MSIKLISYEKKYKDQLFELLEMYVFSVPVDVKTMANSIADFMEDDTKYFKLAVDGNNLVGYCSGRDRYTLYANGKVCYLDEMMVAREYRKHGVGRLMVEDFEKWAVSRDCIFSTMATSTSGGFYESLGYKNVAGFYRKLIN